ncbi:MAG: hypothetical protein Q8M11_23440 [Sulfuritalea sp.]|nr:hypothetical protein [Sulfuritalea sp.]MDP1981855.1 hypothetical protein [Sulfuritalea sp.]
MLDRPAAQGLHQRRLSRIQFEPGTFNLAASGLLWGGIPAQLLDAAQVGEIELFTSRPLLAELSNILARGKFAAAIAATGLPREELVLGYAELTTVVVPAQIGLTIMADPCRQRRLSTTMQIQFEHDPFNPRAWPI